MHARIVLLPVDGENMVNAAANADDSTEVENQKEGGRLLAIDMGAKRVGVAVSDELGMTVRPVTTIERRSWKKLLRSIIEQIEVLEARGLVVGLPLNLDGSEGPAAAEARQIAAKFELSLKIPVYLQDERLTSEEAKSRLQDIQKRERAGDIDSAAAAIILQDFIDQHSRATETGAQASRLQPLNNCATETVALQSIKIHVFQSSKKHYTLGTSNRDRARPCRRRLRRLVIPRSARAGRTRQSRRLH